MMRALKFAPGLLFLCCFDNFEDVNRKSLPKHIVLALRLRGKWFKVLNDI